MFKHLREANETYLEHMIAALKISWTLCVCSGISFVHAIFPFLFVTTVSDKIIELGNYLSKRRSAYTKEDNMKNDNVNRIL